MKKKALLLAITSILTISLFVSCTNSNESGENKDNTAVQDGNKAQEIADMTKADYHEYVTGKYNEYLTNLEVDMKDGFKDIEIKSEDFNTKLKGAYSSYKDKLISFKNSLETDVKSSDEKVKEINSNIIKSIDDTVDKIDTWSKSFEEKSKEFGEKTEEDIKTELKNMGQDVEEARIKLDELINEAKGKLGI